jgi:hypothetical protein
MVKVEPQFNGETAAVRVTLIRGVKGIEQEDFVASIVWALASRRL